MRARRSERAVVLRSAGAAVGDPGDVVCRWPVPANGPGRGANARWTAAGCPYVPICGRLTLRAPRYQDDPFRIGFDPREGLVSHQLSFRAGDRDRPVIYRASVAEMLVPYADPAPRPVLAELLRRRGARFGNPANALVLGCGCPGEIRFLRPRPHPGRPGSPRRPLCP